MKIWKAQITIDNDGVHLIETMDVIEYDGAFWLVPEWLDNPIYKVTKPMRIISLATMVHHRMEGQNPEFLVENPVPMHVFQGRVPPQEASKYVVIEGPEIVIPRDASIH